MSKNKGLGRGIDALFGGSLDNVLSDDDKAHIRQVLIQDIIPNPTQPRRSFDETELAGLASSIERYGVLQPLIVVSHGDKYHIVAGERRWRAAQSVGLPELPVIVRTLEELEQLEIALIENVQRVDLSAYEQALSIYRLREQFNVEYAEIAKRLGKAQTTISNIVRLLNLPKEAIKALEGGEISEGHARAILALDGNSAKQKELLANIISEKWTVRQAEKFVQDNTAKQIKSVKNYADTELSLKLKSPVTIKPKKRGGEVIISYKTPAELERIKKTLLR